MSQTMKLSAEEIALIEQRRAEERANELKLRNSYESVKDRLINSEKEACQRNELQSEKNKKVYETMYANMLEVSPDYKLVCEKINSVKTVQLFDVDEHGSQIRYTENEKGETVWAKPREVVKIKTYHYNLTLSYTGKMPKDFEFYILPIAQYKKYSSRISGYKMQVRGTNIKEYGKSGLMSKATSVHTKIIENVEYAFRQIEFKKEYAQKVDRIIAKYKIVYSKYVANTTIHETTFTVKLDNGITVDFVGSEIDDEITFSNPKIKLPYVKLNVLELLEGLGNVNVGE